MRRLIAVIITLWAVPASAQMPTEHKIGLGLYVGAATLDYHSTYLALSHGAREDNPLGRLTDGSPAGTVLLGAGLDAVATPLLYKWLGKRHPKLTTMLLFGVSGVRLSFVKTNYQNAQRAQ